MSFSIFVSEPKVGQEIQNVQKIIEALEQLNPQESYGVIVSNSSIMGLGASSYTQFFDFEDRQNKAIHHIQSKLKEQQWVIASMFSLKTFDYQPIFIQKEQIIIGDMFEVLTPQGTKRLGILSNHHLVLDFNQPLDACILLEEFVLETDFKDIPHQISLNDRISLTEKKLNNILSSLAKKNNTISFNVPIQEYYNGKIFDGCMGLISNFECEFNYFKAHSTFTFDLSQGALISIRSKRSTSMLEHILSLLCQSIKNYFIDLGLNKAIIALSGGIDSALVAALAVKALGKNNVFGLLMPGPYSTDHSVEDAKILCSNLGIQYSIHSINSIFKQYLDSMDHSIIKSLSLENLQARIRGTILMAYSNEHNALALNTCNKSEDLVGYATLYGDAVGAFAPLGDLYKCEVYELAHYFNAREYKQIIPDSILEKEPSAELRENQKDTDSLPPYHQLDLFLYLYLEAKQDPYKVAKQLGIKEEDVKGLLFKLFSSEYKRKQSPTILQIGNQQNIFYTRELSQTKNWA